MCMCVCACMCVSGGLVCQCVCVCVCVCTSMKQGKGGYVFTGCRQLWSGAWRILLHMFWEHFTQPQNLISGPHKPGTQQQGILYFFLSLSLSLSLLFFKRPYNFTFFRILLCICHRYIHVFSEQNRGFAGDFRMPWWCCPSMAQAHRIKAAQHSWHLLFAFSPRSEFKNNKRSLSFFTCVLRTLREGICLTLRWEKERGMEREIDT